MTQQSSADAREPAPEQVKRRNPVRVDVAWLSAYGIALYVLLRIPFAIFYAKLGTSPEEVGLGYAQLLAQSSLLVASVAAFASLLTFNLLLGTFPTAFASIGAGYRKWNGGGREVRASMSDSEFDAYVAGAMVAAESHSFGRTLRSKALMRQTRLRELDRKGVLTNQEKWERWRLYRGIAAVVSRPALGLLYELDEKRHRLLTLFLLWSFLIMAFGLPVLADQQGKIVQDCGNADNIAGMNYNGTRVELLDSSTLSPRFPERNLLLLGGDSNRYVLFDCRDDATLRLPTSDYVVIHRGQ